MSTRSLPLTGLGALANDFGRDRVAALLQGVQKRIHGEAVRIVAEGKPLSKCDDAWIVGVITILLMRAGSDALGEEMEKEMSQ